MFYRAMTIAILLAIVTPIPNFAFKCPKLMRLSSPVGQSSRPREQVGLAALQSFKMASKETKLPRMRTVSLVQIFQILKLQINK